MNKFLGVGNIGSLPEAISGGCKLSLCTKIWDGKQQKNIWLKVFVFGGAAQVCLDHLEVGRKISVDGRVDISKHGNMVIITDKVEFL